MGRWNNCDFWQYSVKSGIVIYIIQEGQNISFTWSVRTTVTSSFLFLPYGILHFPNGDLKFSSPQLRSSKGNHVFQCLISLFVFPGFDNWEALTTYLHRPLLHTHLKSQRIAAFSYRWVSLHLKFRTNQNHSTKNLMYITVWLFQSLFLLLSIRLDWRTMLWCKWRLRAISI